MTDSRACAVPLKRGSMPASANASPVRKRARLSSPASPLDDDDDFPELDSDGYAALDELEQRHSQMTQERARQARGPQSSPTPLPRSAALKAQVASNPASAGGLDISFTRPSISMASGSRSPTPEAPDKDYDSWLSNSSTSAGPAGFSTITGKKWELSASALEKAAAKHRAWAEEDEKKEQEEANSSTSNVLKSLNNLATAQRPSTPKPAPALSSFSRPTLGTASIKPHAFSTASAIQKRQQVFSSSTQPPSTPTPVRPASALSRSVAMSGAATPRMLGTTPRAKGMGGFQRRFATPFKPGFGPGQPSPAPQAATHATPAPPPAVQEPAAAVPIPPVADVSTVPPVPTATSVPAQPPAPAPPARPTLATCGMQPGTRTQDKLLSLGIPVYLFQMTPRNAQYFAFNSPESTEGLGTQAALDQLLASGCKHATQQWVENHWGLILWKLSGMITNDAEPYDALMKRWNWTEVLAQLNCRYKREYVDGARPALRAVLERDAHAGAPMVLCVSAIEWRPARKNADGSTAEASVALELTDGWYFVRATVDAAIMRGLKHGTIKVGRKIACAGAKLDPPQQDGKDVFSAHNTSTLVLSGNGSAMAPWHAKLGFHRHGFTACLRSLTPDGGMVPLVDVVVVKAYPMAFFETLPDGSRDGPWDEAGEREAQEKWRATREREHHKLVQEFEKQAFAAETLLDKLKRAAGRGFSPGADECMPDHIEDLYEELAEDPNAGTRLRSITSRDAGWMAVYLKDKLEKDKERVAFDIESELAAVCPERSVRSFRVCKVRDTHSARRPATRTAQLTVWDASQLGKDMLVTGARLQITNLAPEQPRAWSELADADGEVFLVTRRNSRVKRMPDI